MDLGLKGKVALVTGGSQGLGRATALKLAAEGAKVVIAARRQGPLDEVVNEITANGGSVKAVQADVSRPEDCQALVQAALDAYGSIDILVNNAGTSAVHPFDRVTDEIWQDDFNLKLFSAIRLVRLAVPYMKEKGWGRIINITNIGAKQPGARTMPTTVTRAAGLALTKALSKELAPNGILVNTVCIGIVRAQQHETKAGALGIPVEALYEERAQSIPLGRVGEAEEVANVVTFLASEAASFVTGTSINLDGGASAVL